MRQKVTLGFAKDERGAVLIEALLVFPVLTLLSFSILEFGYLMWERQQLAAGVRDAARYWSRCRPDIALVYEATCNEATARNIAFYGTPAPGDSDPRRVPFWDSEGTLLFTPAKADLATLPQASDLVSVVGSVPYHGSPAFSAIFDGTITISYSLEMRQIGW